MSKNAISKSKLWFAENVADNKAELIEVGELANRNLHDKISLGLNDPETTIAIYAKIFEAICEEVASKEEDYESFRLNIANRLEVGYTTTSSEDDEKMGNFMVYINHLETPASNDSLDEEETDTIVLCTQWNAANVKTQAETIKAVAARGKKALSEMINIKLDNVEFIIPMFCIIHEQLINYIKLKRRENETAHYELNVAGLFDICAEETDDAEENIYFVPSISLKLLFKSDKIASGKDED